MTNMHVQRLSTLGSPSPSPSTDASTDRLKLLHWAVVAVGTGLMVAGGFGNHGDGGVNTSILFAALAIAALAGLFLRSEQALAFLIFMVPANRLLTVGFVSVLLVVAISLFLRELPRLFHGANREGANSGAVFLGLSTIMVLYAPFVPEAGGLTLLLNTAKTVMALWVLWAFSERVGNSRALARLVAHGCVGVIIGSTVGLFFNDEILEADMRLSVAAEGGENALGVASITLLFLALLLMRRAQSSKERLVFGLLVTGVGAVGVFTASRGFLLGLGVGLVLLLVRDLLRLEFRHVLRGVAWVGTLAAVIWFLGVDEMRARLALAFQRVTDPKDGDISNGRLELWEAYIGYLGDTRIALWFGSGDAAITGIPQVAHNAILEDLVVYGVLGTLLIALLYGIWFKKVCGNLAGKTFSSAVPLIVLFSVSMVSHTFLGLASTILLCLCALCIRTSAKCADASSPEAQKSKPEGVKQ